MKKLRILSLCLALSLTVCLFAGCTDKKTPDQPEKGDNVSDVTQGDQSGTLEGQDQEIEIDEGNVQDPFAE